MKKLIPVLLAGLLLILSGCQKKKAVAVHPGAVSNLDSYAYDILLVEQDVLNQAKTQYQAGGLPPAAKEPMNYAIQQYNVTLAAWQAYHSSASAAGATALQNALNALVAAVGEFQRVLGKQPTVGKVRPIGPEPALGPVNWIPALGGATWA